MAFRTSRCSSFVKFDHGCFAPVVGRARRLRSLKQGSSSKAMTILQKSFNPSDAR